MMLASHLTPVILAAGDSTRMGYPKALLPFGERTFVTQILDIVKGVSLHPPCLILGRHAPAIEPIIADQGCIVLINPDPEKGQLSSIQLAVGHFQPSCGGCLIWPVDQPAVSMTLVQDLVRLFCRSEPALAMPLCRQKRGHPAIFHRRLFDELLAEPTGKGLKELVYRHQHETALLETDEVATIEDIDTPADFMKLTGQTLEMALARHVPNQTRVR